MVVVVFASLPYPWWGSQRKPEGSSSCGAVAAVESKPRRVVTKPRCKRLLWLAVVALVWGLFSAAADGIFGEIVEFRCVAQECNADLPSGRVVAQVGDSRARFMLVVVVDFLEDGGLSRCVVFCWWI